MNDTREQTIAIEYCDTLLKEEGQPMERFLELWRQARQENTIGEMHTTVFTISFSEEQDSLDQWRAYGAANGSTALGFTSEHLREAAAAQGFWLAPCPYAPGEHEDACRELVEWIRPQVAEISDEGMWGLASEFQAAVADLGALLKDYSFRIEKEWRLISPLEHLWPEDRMVFQPGKYGIRQFVKFELFAGVVPSKTEVVFGFGPYGDIRSMVQAAGALRDRLGCGQAPMQYSESTHRL